MIVSPALVAFSLELYRSLFTVSRIVRDFAFLGGSAQKPVTLFQQLRLSRRMRICGPEMWWVRALLSAVAGEAVGIIAHQASATDTASVLMTFRMIDSIGGGPGGCAGDGQDHPGERRLRAPPFPMRSGHDRKHPATGWHACD
ncbi:hypothetical protein [Streptomyces roseolus]|uniref:hypothetical protein n=1 Tax=Streptomyces roseolus TaxID=67358 RepID=UPI0016719696|nr:hypothetical protein [Streptomyces roseolus]